MSKTMFQGKRKYCEAIKTELKFSLYFSTVEEEKSKEFWELAPVCIPAIVSPKCGNESISSWETFSDFDMLLSEKTMEDIKHGLGFQEGIPNPSQNEYQVFLP